MLQEMERKKMQRNLYKPKHRELRQLSLKLVTIEAKNIVAETVVAPFPLVAT